MLASLFSKTKPINYILLIVFLIFAFVLYQITNQSIPTSGYDILKITATLVALIFSVYLTQYIVIKNALVKNNAYAVFFFTMFLIMFPSTLANIKIVIANLFILLAFTRLFSLHSLQSPKEKLFSASLWILAALLFHFWGIIFLLLLFISVIFYLDKDYRNWFIPIIALFTVFVFLSVYLIISDQTYYNWIQDKIVVSFDFTKFKNIYGNIALSIFSSIAIFFFITELTRLKNKQINLQSLYKKIIIAFLIGIAIYVISEDKNNGTLLFTFFPLAVLCANTVETIPQKWKKEVIVCGIFIIALFLYITQLFL